jgi:energy-coupling factor transporter transmembrane protein EcfT
MVAIYIIAATVLLIVVAVFVLIQLKTRWYWRLVSIAVAIFAVARICYFVGRASEGVVLAEYGRSSHDFVEIVDELAVAGRTNDVHQVCQKYLTVYVTKMSDLTNLDTVVQDAADRVAPQTFKLQTLQKP